MAKITELHSSFVHACFHHSAMLCYAINNLTLSPHFFTPYHTYTINMADLINSKSQHPLSSLLKIIFIFISFLLLLHNNAVKSQPQVPDYEAISFSYSSFNPNNPNIIVLGDAYISNGILRLSKTDPQGRQLGVGRALLETPIHLWDKDSGNLADFSAAFTFVVNPPGGPSSLHGDGFALFLAGGRSVVDIPNNSSGGYLGLFSADSAFDPTKNQVLAFELDSYANGWDPNYPHVGIDVGSIKSVVTAPWPSDYVPGNTVGTVSINYDSESKKLTLFMSYNGTGKNATVSYNVDLRNVLPEYVWVGFSGATGNVVETHDILAFHFEYAL